MSEKNRIEILDSFRFLAITAVAAFHYYSMFVPPHAAEGQYEHGQQVLSLFRYGFLGVQFFFIISGFVIFFTLENSKSLFDFFKRRVARLVPPMVLCSLITLGFIFIADADNTYNYQRSFLSILPSITFIKPLIWNDLFNTTSFDWASAVHWSLWHEVQFYTVCSLLFFAFRKNFLTVYTFLSVALILSYWIANSISLNNYLQSHTGGISTIISPIAICLQHIYRYFDLPTQLSFFSIGIYIYLLYKQRKLSFIQEALFAVIICFQYYAQHSGTEKFAFIVILSMFILFLLNSSLLEIINFGWIKRIGVISYTLYLIHGEVGCIIIGDLAAMFPTVTYLIPLFVYALAILFAELSFRFYEKRAAVIIGSILESARQRLVSKRADA